MKIQIKARARTAARLQLLLNYLYTKESCLVIKTSIKNIWVIECKSLLILEAALSMIETLKAVKVLDVIREGEKTQW